MLTLAKDSQAPRLARHTIYAFRLVLGLVWLFWGVRDGLVLQTFGDTPHGKLLVDSLGIGESLFSITFGWLMILLAFWLLAGWASRIGATVQLFSLIFLWWLNYQGAAALFGSVVEQIPMMALIVMIWAYGPGTCVWTKARHRTTWTRG